MNQQIKFIKQIIWKSITIAIWERKKNEIKKVRARSNTMNGTIGPVSFGWQLRIYCFKLDWNFVLVLCTTYAEEQKKNNCVPRLSLWIAFLLLPLRQFGQTCWDQKWDKLMATCYLFIYFIHWPAGLTHFTIVGSISIFFRFIQKHNNKQREFLFLLYLKFKLNFQQFNCWKEIITFEDEAYNLEFKITMIMKSIWCYARISLGPGTLKCSVFQTWSSKPNFNP